MNLLKKYSKNTNMRYKSKSLEKNEPLKDKDRSKSRSKDRKENEENKMDICESLSRENKKRKVSRSKSNDNVEVEGSEIVIEDMDSKSRSKSKDKRKKPKEFRISQKSVLLTYIHTNKQNIQKNELGEYLYKKFDCSITIVAEEHHADGSPHLHVWLEWPIIFNSRSLKTFEFKGNHPHISRMRDKKKNTKSNVIKYLTKEDPEIFVKGMDIQAWLYSSKEHRKYIAKDLLEEKINLKDAVKFDPTLLYNYTKIKNNLESYKMDNKEIVPQRRTLNNLWIHGKAGSGKTFYAVTNFKPYYWKSQSKWWDSYMSQPNIIIDDVDAKSFEFAHNLKIWADEYCTYGEVKNGHVVLNYERIIVTSNYTPLELYGTDLQLVDAITRRFRLATITGEYPNFTLVLD